MLVSLQIQGAPTELVSVLTAIGGISLPVDAPVMPLPVQPVALPAAEPKHPKKTTAKQSTAAPVIEPDPAPSVDPATAADPSPAEPEAQTQSIQQPAEEPKGDRLSLEKIRAVFNDKLAGHRDTIKGILTSYDSKGLTEFYGRATPEQHAEFFNKISAL